MLMFKVYRYKLGTLSIVFLMLLSSCLNTNKASLIVYNAKIYTIDSSFNQVEAMAIKDGKIVATGTTESILKQFDADSMIDAMGNTIFPGFIDAHCHFTGFANDSWKCNLVGTTSFKEVIDSVLSYSKSAPMLWIYGRGWDQNDWEEKSFPDKKILDSLKIKIAQ